MLLKRVILIALLFALPTFIFAQELIKQEYYENGKLRSTSFREGTKYYLLEYYENGKIKEKCVYSEMKRNGKFQSWHQNGIKHMEVEYSNNLPKGDWKMWNDTGKVIGSAKFEHGKLINGAMWDDDGNLLAYR